MKKKAALPKTRFGDSIGCKGTKKQFRTNHFTLAHTDNQEEKNEEK
jgi:hypothetical protein